ncbi:hypothetical protein [Sediminicoccus sp. KRV36]|uniref:hypothetical protein n=1 Tax=Sediminicoccus sp. KRV36 TaxID=3133721 RepID=UPI00200FE6C4|nr:hypothetical protein [Sediminicoccus rosea]UPY36218.1 hypothetical protein LHU95_18665 [Sediminicoccus rosea]
MNETEREVIILNSAWEMIDGMVNWQNFEKSGSLELTELRFQSSIHAKFFLILLGDFLSQIKSFRGDAVPLGLKPVPSNAKPADLTFLFHLRQVCANPKLGVDPTQLSLQVETFASWLETKFTADQVYLSHIGICTDPLIERYRYLKICGDIAKHNLARLSTNIKYIRKILYKSGHNIEE